MSALDDLLAADSKNAGRWRDNFRRFDPSLSDTFDTAGEMFNTFSRCIEGTQDESVEYRILEQYAHTHGLTAEGVIRRIGGAEAIGVIPPEAQRAYIRMWARRARAVLFLLLQRSYLWGATDLLRMRLTSAEGYCRLEAEAIGLMLLIQDDPSVGERWLKVADEEQGRAFFSATQSKLKDSLREVGLISAYDRGSAVSQHLRLASAMHNLLWSETHAYLAYQEAQAEDPFMFFLGVLAFLSIQVYVFQVLKKAFPEVTEPIWDQRVRLFNIEVTRLWDQLEKQFPDKCEAIKKPIEQENS